MDVTGVVAFAVLLDAAVGPGGRYDLVAGALTTVLLPWRLHRRGRHDDRC